MTEVLGRAWASFITDTGSPYGDRRRAIPKLGQRWGPAEPGQPARPLSLPRRQGVIKVRLTALEIHVATEASLCKIVGNICKP